MKNNNNNKSSAIQRNAFLKPGIRMSNRGNAPPNFFL